MAGIFKSLNLTDVRVNPFQAYKKWYGTADLYTLYEGIYEAQLKNLGSPSPYITSTDYTANDKLKGSVYHSTDHLFYRQFYNNTKATFGTGNPTTQIRELYEFITVLSLPQHKVGEGILPNSVRLNLNITGSYLGVTGSVAIVDNGNGDLVLDSNMSTTSSFTKLYKFDGTAIPITTASIQIPIENQVYKMQTDRTAKKLNTLIETQSYSDTKYTWNSDTNLTNITPYTSSRGVTWYMASNSSSVTITPDGQDVNRLYNFINKDYSIGLFVNVNNTPSGSTTYLLKKFDTQETLGLNKNTDTVTGPLNRYPYVIALVGEETGYGIRFSKSNGYRTITASLSGLTPTVDYYIWLTRSGSRYQLSAEEVSNYPGSPFGGIQHFSASLTDSLDDYKCSNYSNLTIQPSIDTYMTIDGLSLFDKGYSDKSQQYYFQLFTGGSNTLNVGNAFYKQGLLTLTDLITYERATPYVNRSLGVLEYRSTQTIYETEVSCTIGAGEFGFSNNPTMHIMDPVTNEFKLRSFATGSNFRPYITQIGLYDDGGNMLVAGKLSQPIKAPDNVDTTFILKFDR